MQLKKILSLRSKPDQNKILLSDKKFKIYTLDDIRQEIENALSLGIHSKSFQIIKDIIKQTIITLPMQLDKSDINTISTATTEMIISFAALNKLKQPVDIVFGPARAKTDSDTYKIAKEFGKIRAKTGSHIGSGGGPGVMEGAHEGCANGGGKAIGFGIRLFFEKQSNLNIKKTKGFEYIFNYFFTRKLSFIKYAHSISVINGGFGSLDELFEAITLVQCGKTPMIPIVLLEPKTTDYWYDLLKWIDKRLLEQGYITKEDTKLYKHFTNAQQASDYIDDFYQNYTTMNYHNNKATLQIKTALSHQKINKIKTTYKGFIEPKSLKQKIDSNGNILLKFKVIGKNYSLLKMIIDEINNI